MAATSILEIKDFRDVIHLQLEDLIGAVRTLTQIVQGLVNDVAKLKGYGLEMRYRQHGAPFFGTAIRRPHCGFEVKSSQTILSPCARMVEPDSVTSTIASTSPSAAFASVAPHENSTSTLTFRSAK